MAEESVAGRSLSKRLGLKAGQSIACHAAPEDFPALLLPLADGVTLDLKVATGPFDVIIGFFERSADLYGDFGRLAAALSVDGGLWVAWPKKAAKRQTDLDFPVVQKIGLAAGLVDNKVCAIDAVWSGLRFVYRLADRPAIRTARKPA